jgi:flotillin
VLAAARSFGERNLDEHAIGDLIEGKLTDALRSVAANQTFMSLHGKRKEFAEHIQAALSEELKKNGLTLENVSITAFAMVPVKELDEHDVFDAEGLRAITESVQSNREKTNQIQREKDNQIQAQNVFARMKQLELEQQQKQAEADQAARCRVRRHPERRDGEGGLRPGAVARPRALRQAEGRRDRAHPAGAGRSPSRWRPSSAPSARR